MTRLMGCAWARIAMAAATMLVALRRGGLAP